MESGLAAGAGRVASGLAVVTEAAAVGAGAVMVGSVGAAGVGAAAEGACCVCAASGWCAGTPKVGMGGNGAGMLACAPAS
jgi:hypothetical protein